MRVLKQGVISRRPDTFFGYHAWPSACIDENGVIYVVCSGGRMGHMCPFGKILLFKSRDGGETFSLPTIVEDSFLDDRDPGLLYLGGGRMLVTCCSHPTETYLTDFKDWLYGDSGEAGLGLLKHYDRIPDAYKDGGCFYKILTEYGEKAGEKKRIPIHSTHGPILLHDGTVFYLGKELFYDGGRDRQFVSYLSRDGGETFEKIADCPYPEGFGSETFHEVHCCELPDGKILAMFRAHLTENDHYFTVMKTITADGGRTWSKWEQTGICGSPPYLCSLPDGRAALTYARRVPPYGIYARLVSSDGEIGEEELLLAECGGSDIGYPASVVLPDGTIFTAYYARVKGDDQASILSVKWKAE